MVSIIVPCYNQAIYLAECLNSVFEQTYSNWECLIIDDGSPDNTFEIANLFIEKDKRFKYFKKENGGLSSARNYGIKQSLGEFILPLDADDKIHQDYISEVVKIFVKDETITVVYCKARLFGTVNKRWYLPSFSPEKLAKDNIIFCSAVIRKKTIERVGGYDEQLIYGKEDWDLWIGIYCQGGKFYRINKILFYYRIKENSMILDYKKNHDKNFYTNSIILKKHHDFFTEAMIKRMYQPLYFTVLNDLKSILMYLYYMIIW